MSEDNANGKAEVRTERTWINSETARKWLRKNIENNRPISQNKVNQYARDMKTGRWKENGDTIVFASTGELIDGQHRLMASVESGIGFWSLVVTGVEKDAFITIDRGQSRSTGQMLHLITGISDYNPVSAAITYLASFRDGIMLNHFRPTTSEAAEILNEHPGIVDSVAAARRVYHRFKAGSIPVLAICHYLFTRQDDVLAEAFFDALATGANLREIDPVYQLRSRIITAASSGRRIASYEMLALYFKAWIAEREQTTMKILRWQAGESFPNIGPVGHAKMRPSAVPVEAPVKKKRVRPPVKPPEERRLPGQPPPTKLDLLIDKHKGLDNQ